MTSEFRASRPEDAPAIAELCQRALAVPASSPMFSKDHMQWKYWEPRPDWPGSRSYVLVRDDRIVAHGAAWPLHFRRQSARHALVHWFDWAAEPGAMGSGAALLRRAVSLAAGMLVVGGSSDTQRMLIPLGFRRLGEVARYSRRSSSSSLGASEGAGIEVLPLAAGEGAFEPTRGTARLAFERSAALLAALRHCPVADFEACRVVRNGEVLGAFVLSFVPFQSRIVALSSASPEAAEGALVVGEALRRAVARQPQADVVAMTSSASEMRALEAAGFVACDPVPMFVAAPPEIVPPAVEIQFQMLDGDVAFLHHGAPDPWG